MRYKDIIIIIIIIPLITGNTRQIAFAESYTKSGLIEKCSLSCVYVEDGKVKINAKTQAVSNMKEIGFVDMKIQRSSDGDNWTDESVIGDNIVKNKKFYSLSGFTADIEGGYYYRVTCTHYAKGVPFKSDEEQIQTAVMTSKCFWVDTVPRQIPVSTTGVNINSDLSTVTTTAVKILTTTAITSPTTTGRKPPPVQTLPMEETDTRAVTKSSTESPETNQNISGNQNNSPKTGVKIPYEILAAGVLSVLTAMVSRKKYVK